MTDKSDRKKQIFFEVGGRYRNRFGWYQVLKIVNDSMLVQYESDGREQYLDLESQRRIMSNIEAEEKAVTPYENSDKNATYFKTLSYITNNGFIEAIIPPKSKSGFDNAYSSVKGCYPNTERKGYYLHHDENVDKWGVEMRLTFTIPNSVPLDRLEFGPGIDIVRSPNANERRINSNALCWRLMELGFDLGSEHSLEMIRGNIPENYRTNYDSGTSIT